MSRSLDAFRAAPSDRDALTVGASVFFGVPYAEVTREQRAAWKWATSALRNEVAEPPPQIERPVAERVKQAYLNVWPALRAFLTNTGAS